MDDVDRLDALARMLDHALTRGFESALADRSTTSAEFVVLSVLGRADAPLTWEALEARLPAGYGAARATEAWEGLEAAGWAGEVDHEHVATDAGLTALEELHAEIESLHDRARAGVADGDYAIAVGVLQEMLANLED
ncbi:hypothetical protein [Demequina sp. NBRC 110056]|uniref:hypothetical protein n=1 Tax=Demequina sp. NBRC 110056 TaxID=1570345 RepID=UPI00117E3B63|nr:hypothetical protein [Demequina sp. NBRC 110056]